MKVRTREDRLVGTFVTLADSLVADYDVVDLLQLLVEETIELFDAAAAGILLVNRAQELEVIVSTNERSEFLGLMQLRAGEGPCVEAVTTGAVVSVADMDHVEERWPLFAADARRSGFRSMHSIPMRLRDNTIGSLNLFRDRIGQLNDEDAMAAQALADVATIGILQHRIAEEAEITQTQLQNALDSRVAIEQAKGYLAHTQGIDMDAAFGRIRANARSTQRRLRDVAADVITGRLDL